MWSSAAGTLGGQAKETVKFAGTHLYVESAPVKTQEEHVSQVAVEILELGSLTILGWR